MVDNGPEFDYARQLELVNSWISNADAKANAVLVTSGIMLGFLASQVSKFLEIATKIKLGWCSCTIGFVATALLLLTVVICLGALFPRLDILKMLPHLRQWHKRVQDRAQSLETEVFRWNPLYFGDVAEVPLSDFVKVLDGIESQGSRRTYYLEQIHTNSTIAAIKFANVKAAITCLVSSIVLYVLFVCIVIYKMS